MDGALVSLVPQLVGEVDAKEEGGSLGGPIPGGSVP